MKIKAGEEDRYIESEKERVKWLYRNYISTYFDKTNKLTIPDMIIVLEEYKNDLLLKWAKMKK